MFTETRFEFKFTETRFEFMFTETRFEFSFTETLFEFIFAETLSNFMFTGLMSFENPPSQFNVYWSYVIWESARRDAPSRLRFITPKIWLLTQTACIIDLRVSITTSYLCAFASFIPFALKVVCMTLLPSGLITRRQ